MSAKEYVLVLQNDINTVGNTQWFFFSVSNMKKGQSVKFNLVNMVKQSSLFSCGMKPAVFSKRAYEEEGRSWFRDGYSISYRQNHIQRENRGHASYYTLSFTYDFHYDNDTVYFAYSYPYTYSDLNNYLTQLLADEQKQQFVSRKVCCKTIAQNNFDMITITSNDMQVASPPQPLIQPPLLLMSPPPLFMSSLTRPGLGAKLKDKRRGIVFLARQHPGEITGSYMMEGVLDFLTGTSVEAEYLRQHCVFKLFPMLNIDGVVHGNNRCSLAGVDLNRRWKNPSRVPLTLPSCIPSRAIQASSFPGRVDCLLVRLAAWRGCLTDFSFDRAHPQKLHPTVFAAKNIIYKFQQEREVRLVVDFHGHSKK